MGRVIPFIACVLVASMASATVLVPAEFSEIVQGSQIIAYARIVDARPEWADGRRWIDTVVTADVVSSLKGSPGETLTFKVPGGRLGRYQSVVVGAPSFAVGDEAVLFLKTHGDELPDVFGLNQGVFRVVVDSRTGQRLVVPPPVMKIANSSEPERVVRGALDRRPLALDAFGARVLEVMAAKPAPRVRKDVR
ncbi:MAG TPA: hypothetical protein VH740_24105 [Vicinamibacterales bacterium]|jgi:hypothetical protein